MSTLREMYSEITNASLFNLNLERKNRIMDALQGWKSLHTSVLYKLDALERQIKNQQLSEEEENLLSDIKGLKSQSDQHLERLQKQVDTDPQLKKYRAVKPAASSVPTPTLRTSNPKPMSKPRRPMANTMRSGRSVNSSSLSSAKAAANLSWNHEDGVRRNWSPSKPLSSGYSKSDPDFVTSDLRRLEARSDALDHLEQRGRTTKMNRKPPPADLIDLSDLNLQTPSASVSSVSHSTTAVSNSKSGTKLKPPVPPKRLSKSAENISPSSANVGKPPGSSARVMTPSAKAKSPPVKAKSPPAESPPTNHPIKSINKAPLPNKVEPCQKETETLDSDTAEDVIDPEDEEALLNSLRGVDKGAAKQILNEIVVHGDQVFWNDIAGLESAKSSLKEAVVYPFLRPDLFSGLREPARGMLLFGPPGTGKTMLARAVATESQSTFFSISASSLTSKFLGESEKLVRALFQLAKKLAPSIIFVDEIDSLLSSRNNEGENESSRRIKNEFLVQWSDLTKAAAGRDQGEDLQRVLVLAATNLPWAIDEAARRRFVRRQYIPLPEPETRHAQLTKLLSIQNHTLTDADFDKLLRLTEGFSGSDITALAKDAAMGPLRQLGDKLLLTKREDIRAIQLVDFENSLNYIRPSVSKEGLKQFEEWASEYGSSGV